MVCRGAACDECTKNCQTIHQERKELSPAVTRFFKIMFGKDYSKVLYFPPGFAKMVKHLSGHKTQIEDSNGLQWSVTLSYVNGSLAFRKGWRKFFVDHNLEEGQLLVFNYIKGSHFFVQIFGRSACEKINFNNGMPRQNKRFKRGHATTSEDEPYPKVDVNSGDKLISATSVSSGSKFEFQNSHTNLAEANRMQLVPSSVNMEDQACMIFGDDGNYQGEDRNFLFDLSTFEMENGNNHKCLNLTLNTSHAEIMETKLEEALQQNTSPSRTGIPEQTKTMEDDAQMDMVHSGDIFTDKLRTKLAFSHIDNAEQTKTLVNDAQMAVMHAHQVKGCSGGIFADRFEKDLEAKLASCHTGTAEQMHTNHVKGCSGGVFTNKLEKTLDTKTTPSSTEITEQVKAEVDVKSNLSKSLWVDVRNFRNDTVNAIGNNHVPKPDSEISKTAEREHAGRITRCESSVFGITVKKEMMELENKAYVIPQVSCENVWKNLQMFPPKIKVEPVMSYDMSPSDAISSFSAEVKSQAYLELPVHIPSIAGRREAGVKVVYLRNSLGRMWPVLYHEIYSGKALTANWTTFCQQNNIKPGDNCSFRDEKNHMLRVYRVDVARRSGDK